MRVANILCFLLAGASAMPTVSNQRGIVATRDVSLLEARDLLTRDDLEDGDPSNCPTAILIYARGSTEPGNLVRHIGLRNHNVRN
jgi:cutinase